jgi:hypothetical protein
MVEGYDYHFMVLAPGLQSAWFFQAARQYWQRYQPTVTDDLALLGYLPAEARIAVTVLARSDTADYIQGELQNARSDLRVDMIVSDDLPSMEATLNSRAQNDLPLG